jgi:hypothetical protein
VLIQQQYELLSEFFCSLDTPTQIMITINCKLFVNSTHRLAFTKLLMIITIVGRYFTKVILKLFFLNQVMIV